MTVTNSSIQIFNNSCYDLEKIIKNQSLKIDMVLSDPPYGKTNCDWDRKLQFADFWEYKDKKYKSRDELLTKLFREGLEYKNALKIVRTSKKCGLWSILKESISANTPIVLFGQNDFSAELIQTNSKEYRYSWIWEKPSASGHMNAHKMPLRSHEDILVFYRALPQYNPQKTTGHKRKVSTRLDKTTKVYGKQTKVTHYDSTERFPRSVIKFSKDKQKSSLHPTQKPVALLEYLIKSYTNPGDTVLDFSAGSFSTAIACINTGRKFVGFELTEKFFNIGKERIENHLKDKEGKDV